MIFLSLSILTFLGWVDLGTLYLSLKYVSHRVTMGTQGSDQQGDRICALHSAWSGVGPMCFPIRARYLVSCFFACTLAKCTAAVSDCLTDELMPTPLRHTVPCQGWRTDTCLHFFQDGCNDVMGKELRLWSCPPAAVTESYIQDTTGVLELPTSSYHGILYPRCKPPGGSRGELLLSPRVWKGCQQGGH
jgi:hypothetical protein